MQKPKDGKSGLQRVVLCGDHYQNSPVIQGLAFRHYANLEQSLFSRLVRLGVPAINLDQQGRARPSISNLYRWRYPQLGDLPHTQTTKEFLTANAGFKYDYQFINVPDYKGKGETEPSPHFIQNLGEAEYAVAIFQYMRLLGYPASKISILATYAGQRALIKDVLTHRCAKNPIFGLPRLVTTVEKYQGEQNDCKPPPLPLPHNHHFALFELTYELTDIILSLTRTTRVGYLRDIRRLTVALSRARLGLYILGRRDVFEACFELREAFALLLKRPDKLALVTGEMWPAERVVAVASDGSGDAADGGKAVDGAAAVPGEAVMEGVEHLGQYVFEMAGTRVKLLRAERGLPEVEGGEVVVAEGMVEEGEGGAVEEEDAEEAVRPEGFEAEEDE
jgi:intron-binding protein aquarius